MSSSKHGASVSGRVHARIERSKGGNVPAGTSSYLDDGGGNGSGSGPGAGGDRNDGGTHHASERAARLDGLAPGGMWWVARRQHRTAIVTTVVILGLGALGMVAFRAFMAAKLGDATCFGSSQPLDDGTPCVATNWPRTFEGLIVWEHIAIVGAAIALGGFAGAAPFPREFGQGTQVFALTQSVGRFRWWAAKITVVGAPLIAGLLGIGFLSRWVDSVLGRLDLEGPVLGDVNFSTWSIMPAAWALVTFALAAAAGVVTRKTLASLAIGFIGGGVIVAVMLNVALPNLLPATRMSGHFTPEENASVSLFHGPDDHEARVLDWGYVTETGRAIPDRQYHCTLPESAFATGPDDQDRALRIRTQAAERCHAEQGIVGWYTDYLPGSILWPLRGAIGGICVILAALFLWLGAARLRKSVAKR